MNTITKNFTILILILLAAAMSKAMTPTEEVASFPNSKLEDLIPKSFGDWKMSNAISPVLPDPTTLEAISNIYSDTLARTYVNSQGAQIMLSLAYGRKQNDTMRVHRPEGCYAGQGFAVKTLPPGIIKLDDSNIAVTRLSTKLGNRSEPVTYWIVIGGKHATTQTEMKIAQLSFGLRGYTPDGLLFRVSSITSNEQAAFDLAEVFVQDLTRALPDSVKNGLVGL
jgi:EpsI family protein